MYLKILKQSPSTPMVVASEKRGNLYNKTLHSLVNEKIPSSFKYEDFFTNISLLFFTNMIHWSS